LKNDCCLIIPCFNEEKRISQSQYLDFFEQNLCDVMFVDDGSKDQTLKVLEELSFEHEHVSVVSLEKNTGKANAIRQGMLKLKDDKQYSHIGYWDADLATPFDQFNFFLAKKDSYDFILGSRVNLLGSKIERKWYRHLLGRVFATLASLSLKIPVYDTQCGAKLLRRTLVEDLFTEKFISYWLFDVELLFRLKRKPSFKVECLLEIPLSKWEDIAGSKLSIKDFIKAPLELLRMYFHY